MFDASTPSAQRAAAPSDHGTDHDATSIARWIALKLEEALELEPGEMRHDQPFDVYGLDSTLAVTLVGNLEDWLGRSLAPNLVYEYPTIAALAGHLASARRDLT